MDEAQLRNFLLVAREGSLSRAANDAYISVPSLKAQMDRLEAELSARLFTRTNRGVALTREGALFLSFAKDVIQKTDGIKERFQAASLQESETIRVGYNTKHIRDHIYYDALADFISRHPNAQVNLSPAPTFDTENIDLFLGICEADGHRIIRRKLGLLPLYCIMPIQCGLSGRSVIEAVDLTGRNVLIPPENLHDRISPDLKETLDRHAVRYRINQGDYDQYTIQGVTKGQISIIIGKESTLPATLVQIPLAGFRFEYYIYCSGRASKRHIVQHYLETLQKHYAQE